MKPFSSEKFESLYTTAFALSETPEQRIEALRHKDVFRYRVKTIVSGEMLECEIYPLWKTQTEVSRAKKANPSRQAQEKLNITNTQKKVSRYLNTNFDNRDLWCTFGWDDDTLPETPEECRKEVINFLRRIKRLRRKKGLSPLRYVYAVEFADDGKKVRVHTHIVMSGDLSRDEIESLWHGGNYPQTRRLRVKDDCGLAGLAHYIVKGGRYDRVWGHSTNLKPCTKASIADKKITLRKAEKIAAQENVAPEIFERLYPEFKFRDVDIRRSDFVAGVYIYVKMHRKNMSMRK
jgi:hypothetical protein